MEDKSQNEQKTGDDAGKKATLAPHPALAIAHSWFEKGNYVKARAEAKKALADAGGDERLKKEAMLLLKRMGVDRAALIVVVAVLALLFFIAYLGIFSRL
ncbi:MAG: hypothetical protein Kow0090_21890 [Myxococcota bacterium]